MNSFVYPFISDYEFAYEYTMCANIHTCNIRSKEFKR